MTYSIGFRSPVKGEIARELLQSLAEQAVDDVGCAIYRDPKQPAVSGSGEIPAGLVKFAQDALAAALKDPLALQRSLGEIMTEPKAHVWFHGEQEFEEGVGVRLDKRSRMMYDAKHVFINGESFRAAGSDAKLMRKLADNRELSVAEVVKLSDGARELLTQWGEDGWLYGLH
jgi:50S ribosomal protein L16 3-hydroxylase